MVHEIIETCSTRVQSKVCSARTTSLDFVHETLLNFFRAYNAPKTPSWIKNLDTLCCNCKQCRFKKIADFKTVPRMQHHHPTTPASIWTFFPKTITFNGFFFFSDYLKSHLACIYPSCLRPAMRDGQNCLMQQQSKLSSFFGQTHLFYRLFFGFLYGLQSVSIN